MSDLQRQYPPIDALSGMISPSGVDCGYLAEAVSGWAATRWPGSRQAIAADQPGEREASTILDQIADDLRQLTGHSSSVIARCLSSASAEELLQWAVVLCRRLHQADTTSDSRSNDRAERSPLGARCLAAVGSDHGTHTVGRMLSGRAELHDPAWPLVSGVSHADLHNLHEHIDDSVAMVIIAPLEKHHMLRRVSEERLIAIRDACDRHRAYLVIDHRDVPPLGGGHFWVHDSLADVTADAVLMSAGLTGGENGGLLVLNQRLAETAAGEDHSGEQVFAPNAYVAQLIAATLRQWSEHTWQLTDVDEFATSLAHRLASRPCVRDLHFTGRSIGIELDLPAQDWRGVAADFSLHVGAAGEFAIALQPPLVLSPSDQADLLDRIDLVFDCIEIDEQEQEVSSSGPAEHERAATGAETPAERAAQDNPPPLDEQEDADTESGNAEHENQPSGEDDVEHAENHVDDEVEVEVEDEDEYEDEDDKDDKDDDEDNEDENHADEDDAQTAGAALKRSPNG